MTKLFTLLAFFALFRGIASAQTEAEVLSLANERPSVEFSLPVLGERHLVATGDPQPNRIDISVLTLREGESYPELVARARQIVSAAREINPDLPPVEMSVVDFGLAQPGELETLATLLEHEVEGEIAFEIEASESLRKQAAYLLHKNADDMPLNRVSARSPSVMVVRGMIAGASISTGVILADAPYMAGLTGGIAGGSLSAFLTPRDEQYKTRLRQIQSLGGWVSKNRTVEWMTKGFMRATFMASITLGYLCTVHAVMDVFGGPGDYRADPQAWVASKGLYAYLLAFSIGKLKWTEALKDAAVQQDIRFRFMDMPIRRRTAQILQMLRSQRYTVALSFVAVTADSFGLMGSTQYQTMAFLGSIVVGNYLKLGTRMRAAYRAVKSKIFRASPSSTAQLSPAERSERRVDAEEKVRDIDEAPKTNLETALPSGCSNAFAGRFLR